MPGRGLVTVALLVMVALGCIAFARRLESERRLVARLRERASAAPGSGLLANSLSFSEQEAARSLSNAGAIVERAGCYHLEPERLRVFRRKRLRLTISGALGALGLAIAIAALLLHR